MFLIHCGYLVLYGDSVTIREAICRWDVSAQHDVSHGAPEQVDSYFCSVS